MAAASRLQNEVGATFYYIGTVNGEVINNGQLFYSGNVTGNVNNNTRSLYPVFCK